MKYFAVFVGVLVLLAVGQAQNEETTVGPSDEDGSSSPAPSPPSRRPRPPGPRPKPQHPIGSGPRPPHSNESHQDERPPRIQGSLASPQDRKPSGPLRRRRGQQEAGNDNSNSRPVIPPIRSADNDNRSHHKPQPQPVVFDSSVGSHSDFGTGNHFGDQKPAAA